MESSTQQQVSLRHYLQILWRRKLIVIATLILVPAVVLGVSLTRPKQYEAKARIMVVSQDSLLNAATGANLGIASVDERGVATLASFIATPEVAAAVKSTLGWPDSIDALIKQITVSTDPTANVISVVADRPDANQAADLANAFAGQFVARQRQSQQASVQDALKLVDQQLAHTPTASVEYTNLTFRRSQLQVISSLITGGMTLGQAAQPPAAPSSPKPVRDGALAVAAALVLGIGFAFLREALDVRIHDIDEIADGAGVPVLGTIAEFDGDHSRNGHVVTVEEPRGQASEAYRFLRTNLEFVDFDHETRTVLVTSPIPGQGKSTTIVNLAVTLLKAGKRVAVVEGDLRRPALHGFFKVKNTLGVTTVVSGASTLEEAAIHLTLTDRGFAVVGTDGGGVADGSAQLLLLTSGPTPPNPGEIVSSPQLASILAALRSRYDYVLVDAPPMFVVGDAGALAGLVDGVIVILRFAQTTTATLRSVRDFVARVPARTLGVVVTHAPKAQAVKYSGYTDYYH